ncbi:MAG TPA: hypothetical protein VN759_12455, partial [Pseudolysinimonas sp.]|nr:hypothetical protein [Pseudolysinimonas sp.]
MAAVTAAAFLAATGFAVSAPQPADAFAGSCPDTTPAAVLVADGICEVRFTASGVFTPPAGIATLSGILVGGGGGAISFDPVYIVAGKGGAVLAVDALPVDGDLEIEIGIGGFSVVGGGVAPGDG